MNTAVDTPIAPSKAATLPFKPDIALSLMIGIIVMALVAFQPKLLDDGDTWWHLAAGDWILNHWTIPTTDPFSYTMPGSPWHAHEWLAEGIMQSVYRLGGWSGILLFFGAISGLTFGLLTHALQRWLTPIQIAVLIVFIIPILATKLLARPHVLAFPVLIVWLTMLVDARARNRVPHWGWIALMVFWANLHGSFQVGLGLVALCAGEAFLGARGMGRVTVVRDWGLFFVGCLLASLATPFGFNAHLFAFQVSNMEALSVISEWAPTGTTLATDRLFWLALIAGLLLVVGRGIKLPVLRMVAVLIFFTLAALHTRHQTVFMFLMLMLLTPAIGAHLNAPHPAKAPRKRAPAPRGLIIGLGIAAVALGIARMSVPVTRTDGPNAPLSALAAVPASMRAQPMLNSYGFGGFLIYSGPFIDGRADMYGDPFTMQASRAENGDAKTLDTLIAKYKVQWTIFEPDDGSITYMDNLKGWKRLYTDKTAVVHVRGRAGTP